MRQTLRLGSISGIPIGINWGLLLIAAFYLFNLAVGILPAAVPGASAVSYWFFGAVGVVAFFASVLAHELGHSIVAQRNNIRVRAITLWLLGGVAELETEADDPGVEFRIAVAGPLVSVVLAVVFGALYIAMSAVLVGSMLSVIVGYLAIINVALAVFNMIPAAPLDGGRVLAAALWWKSNNRHSARAMAARVGQVFGTALLGVGIVGWLLGAGTFIWMILGFFLRTAATAERRRAEMLDAISSADLATSMYPIVAPVTAGITLAGLDAMRVGAERPVAFPLWVNGVVVGLIPSTTIDRTPITERWERRVEESVVDWDAFVSARVDEPMDEVVARARSTRKSHVLVYGTDGTQVGYVPLDGSIRPMTGFRSSATVPQS